MLQESGGRVAMKLRGKTATFALIPVIVLALVFGAYLSISLNNPAHQEATTSTPASTTESVSSFTSTKNSISTSIYNESTMETETPTVTGQSSSSVSSISTNTYSTESMTGTGTSIPGWEFLARIVITGSDAMVNSNLTYTSSGNATIELGYPIAVTVVRDTNGDAIWSTISTALLRIFNVTYGQSFTSTVNVSGVLQAGKSYIFDVRPQINSPTGEFLGGQLQLSFEIAIPPIETSLVTSNTSVLATSGSSTSSQEMSCMYTYTQEPTTYTTVSDQTVTQSYYAQTITTVC